jgi:hypothetical protein
MRIKKARYNRALLGFYNLQLVDHPVIWLAILATTKRGPEWWIACQAEAQPLQQWHRMLTSGMLDSPARARSKTLSALDHNLGLAKPQKAHCHPYSVSQCNPPH